MAGVGTAPSWASYWCSFHGCRHRACRAGSWKPFKSPAVPLFVVVLMPLVAPMLNGPAVVLWMCIGMTIITIIKRLEANQRPLPAEPVERRKIILRRIFLDRDIQDQQAWIHREPSSANIKSTGEVENNGNDHS